MLRRETGLGFRAFTGDSGHKAGNARHTPSRSLQIAGPPDEQAGAIGHDADMSREAIVIAIIQMAHSLGFKTIAKGVETDARGPIRGFEAKASDEVYPHSPPILERHATMTAIEGEDRAGRQSAHAVRRRSQRHRHQGKSWSAIWLRPTHKRLVSL